MQILSNRCLPNGTKASPIFFTGKKKMHRPVVFRETDSIYIWVDRALFGRGCSSFVRKMIYTPGNFHGSNMECYISVQQTKKMKHLDDQRTTVLFCYIRGIPKAAGNLLNWMSRLCWQYRGKKTVSKRCLSNWTWQKGMCCRCLCVFLVICQHVDSLPAHSWEFNCLTRGQFGRNSSFSDHWATKTKEKEKKKVFKVMVQHFWQIRLLW